MFQNDCEKEIASSCNETLGELTDRATKNQFDNFCRPFMKPVKTFCYPYDNKNKEEFWFYSNWAMNFTSCLIGIPLFFCLIGRWFMFKVNDVIDIFKPRT